MPAAERTRSLRGVTAPEGPERVGGWRDGDPAGDRRFLELPGLDLERGGWLPSVRVA